MLEVAHWSWPQVVCHPSADPSQASHNASASVDMCELKKTLQHLSQLLQQPGKTSRRPSTTLVSQ